MKKLIFIALFIFGSISISALASPTLDELSHMGENASSINDTVNSMLSEAGYDAGFRAGKEERIGELIKMLNQYGVLLDQLYNFAPLINDKGVLPPVIVESQDAAHITDDQIRTIDKVYAIIKPERFVSNPPTWREYLLMGLMPSNMPMPIVKIKTAKERDLWIASLRSGWQEGRDAADNILNINFNRLTRDYVGMLTYLRLVHLNMVHLPTITESEQVLTGTDKQLSIGDKNKQIKTHSTFNTHPNQWKPILNNR